MKCFLPALILWSVQPCLAAEFLLPAKQQGIVVDVAQKKLFFFPGDGSNIVSVFPVAVRRPGIPKKSFTTEVFDKVENPMWRPSDKMRERMRRKGQRLSRIVRPGPHNPLGKYAIYLNNPRHIIIHGTNEPESIGTSASSGCVRMYEEDIKVLFDTVSIGTQVTVIDD